MNMLASDLNNPEFMNPIDPDASLHVEFYWAEPVDGWASNVQQKRVTLPKQPFVRIMKPGDNTSILEVPVREDHKKRWPQKWMYFQMKEGLIDTGVDIPGWKIEEWDEMKDKPELVRGLKFIRFHTVEQIAGASDAQIQGIGLGGYGLREKAKAALREHIGVAARNELEIRDRKIAEQNTALEATNKALAALQEQINVLMTGQVPALPVDSAAPTEPAKKRRGMPKGGWPKKPKVE